MVRILQSLIRLGLFLGMLSCLPACQPEKEPPLRVAAAANLQYTIREISAVFQEETGIQVDIIIGSSGKLTAQIEQGAPFDVFIAADMKYPTALYEKGYAETPPERYAYGRLVLWSMNPSRHLSMDALTSQDIDKIALPNPKTAPYGEAVVQSLRQLNLYDTLLSRFVYGESIAQTSQFIQSGAVEAGFTAQSIVLAGPAANQGHWVEVPPDTYKPIAQGALLLNGSEKMQAKARKFYNFLFSSPARQLFIRHGYKVKEPDESITR